MLTWLLHYISAPRQSAQSVQLSFQLLLLKSCINIPDQLILSMGFKPHWHADESLIKWQAWEPSAVKEFASTVMMGPESASPEEDNKNSLLSSRPIWNSIPYKGILNCTQFSKHPSLNTMKHVTRKGKEMLVCTLPKWNTSFSETGRLMWIKEMQMSLECGRSCKWIGWKTWILNCVRAGSSCISLVPMYILTYISPQI